MDALEWSGHMIQPEYKLTGRRGTEFGRYMCPLLPLNGPHLVQPEYKLIDGHYNT
ncbi:hypothetical protein A2U01_0078730, partial [Trifolium medium]|nr:hypothetical protein [Trifolium medium]